MPTWQGAARARIYHTVDLSSPLAKRAEFEAHGRAWIPGGDWSYNSFLYDASIVTQRLLRGSPDGKNYAIRRAYVEFENSGAPVDPVPTISRSGNKAGYYNSLSAPRDYLRVSVAATLEVNDDDSLYQAANRAVFLIETSGSVGAKNGLTFSDGAGSVVYGGALVAAPNDSDASQDLVYARVYHDPGDQQEKLPGAQIALRWELPFE